MELAGRIPGFSALLAGFGAAASFPFAFRFTGFGLLRFWLANHGPCAVSRHPPSARQPAAGRHDFAASRRWPAAGQPVERPAITFENLERFWIEGNALQAKRLAHKTIHSCFSFGRKTRQRSATPQHLGVARMLMN